MSTASATRPFGITPATGTRDAGDDARWEAVLARAAQLDERFVYAVRSTRVYCRPACPSRRPLRRNVIFFAEPTAARAAGYRACRRCRPDEVAPPDAARAKILAACRYVEAADGRVPALEEIAQAVGLSPSHLQRAFTRLVGVSPRRYADAVRLLRLKRELREGEPIASALYGVGYGSASRLYEAASAQLGMTPRTYRRGGRGERIRFATARTALGHVLLAATHRGVCAVRLGDDRRALEDELRREFHGAELVRADASLARWLAALVAHLDTSRALPDLPLDVRATAFQRRVWEAIRAVPAGRTATYGEIARAVGAPNAVRGVAGACAANPIALVVPCHRIVPKSGGTGGYRWGARRKRALLAAERAAAGAEEGMVTPPAVGPRRTAGRRSSRRTGERESPAGSGSGRHHARTPSAREAR